MEHYLAALLILAMSLSLVKPSPVLSEPSLCGDKRPPPQECQPYAEKCPACKDCTQCKHCSVIRGKCSVCWTK